jgi:hypothetical protein
VARALLGSMGWHQVLLRSLVGSCRVSNLGDERGGSQRPPDKRNRAKLLVQTLAIERVCLSYIAVLIVTCVPQVYLWELGSLVESPSSKGCVLTQPVPARVLARNRQKGEAYH